MSNILFFDLEFTCWEDSLKTNWSDPDYPAEVIQIGLVIYDDEKEKEIDSFSSYVRPTINAQLSNYCKALTGIPQECVVQADRIDLVNSEIENWLSQYTLDKSYSWGRADLEFWSRHSLRENSVCPIHAIPYTDMMKVVSKELNMPYMQCERKTAREQLEMKMSEKHIHNALSDAADLIDFYQTLVLHAA